ncbi:uncharacterized protein TNCV_4949531 [Trichonephila clavipes]|nr:uncharacterized protein TNCV_4949531 [Trichonephila clavipes]
MQEKNNSTQQEKTTQLGNTNETTQPRQQERNNSTSAAGTKQLNSSDIYSLVHGTAADFAQLKQALKENFSIVRNQSELEARFYSTYRVRGQASSDFIYDLLKIHKRLKLNMSDDKLREQIMYRLEPQIREIRNATTETELLQ